MKLSPLSHWGSISFLSLLATGSLLAANAQESKSLLTFYAPSLTEVGHAFDLSVYSEETNLKGWIVHWGDGTETPEDSSVPETKGLFRISHTYPKPGVYQVNITDTSNDNPALVDYAQLILADHPLAYYRFEAPIHSSGPTPSLDGKLKPSPPTIVSGLPWNAPAASFGTAPVRLPRDVARPFDRFSVDFWLRSQDISSRQTILSSSSSDGAQLYLAKDSLCLTLPKGAVFSQSLPDNFKDGAWHHLAVVYDRGPLFPYQNTARFYLDGVVLGEQHLDLYDTGPVIFPNATLGSDARGANKLKGHLAEFALYDHLLPPLHILDHVKPLFHPHDLSLLAATPCVEPFTIDPPRLTQTINVPLGPSPTTDNGPALRTAINQAAPGTRLVIVNRTTNKPGGTFYVSSLDSGNDWSAFRIFNKRDLEIDGGGATFIFRVANRQFFLRDSQRIALRNFSIDLDQSKFRVGVYARIMDMNAATGDIRFQFVNGRDMSPDHGVPATIAMWRWRPHDPKTLRITKGPFFKTGEAFVSPPQRDPNDASILTGRIKPSLIKELEDYRQGANFFMVNNAHFENTSMSVYKCEHITIDHINYYATLGMVFLSGEENHVQVTHCKIGLPPGLTAADRPLASGADGYHFHDTQGDILFDHNEIALTDDDPVTIKDGVFRDVSAPDNTTLAIKGDLRVGDEIELYNWDFSPLNYRGHVIQFDKGHARMDTPLPANLPKTFTALNLRHHTNNWILQDNDLHDYYGRLLLCTAHGFISGNTIQHSWFHLGASNASFDSAGFSSFVTIYNNLFIDTNADTGIWGAASAYPVFQGITFYQNSFIGGRLHLGNSGNPWIVGNYFEERAGTPPKENAAVISLGVSGNPFVLDNLELVAQPADFSLTTKTTDGLTSSANTTLLSPVQSTALY